ncbi:hypothetical protein B0G77_7904 [Paraburkholderia sp. BL10I2N1]|nr:hypothetical protein B0G77_7904 [Paraburkholderia sp. BL10I2N1]
MRRSSNGSYTAIRDTILLEDLPGYAAPEGRADRSRGSGRQCRSVISTTDSSRQTEDPNQHAATLAQATARDRTGHRPYEGRPRHAALPAQKANRRCGTRGTVCCRLQPALVAARHRPSGPGACIFYPRGAALARQWHAAAERLLGTTAFDGLIRVRRRRTLGLARYRKLNFAGSTIYPHYVFDSWIEQWRRHRAQQGPGLRWRYCRTSALPRELWGRTLARHLGGHGLHVGVHPIKRLRRKQGLRCNQKRKFKATTRLTHGLPVAPNLLDQAFAVTVPNQAWCGDIRYIATKPSKPHKSMRQKPC